VSGTEPVDERRFNEKLDDVQAAHPLSYNLAVGAVMALVLVLIGLPWLFAPVYALSYAALRWFLWQDGRVLRRQYDARKVRCAAEAAARRRRT
jgi:hypothetical protein